MKIFISVVFLAIVASLVMAGYFMLKRGGAERSRNMALALTIRIGLSVALFVGLLILWSLGYITPTGHFPAQ
jgi:prepilin signal peptidase PulO-like enzyme (type II secretory pathway)